ncbi:hypothetical protein JTE90_006073 [Oedothorax gibbosus]|uniref:Uncharacterized protein n=1 Tax=Oedothorax gibbosus TaxID=931172 RepID=A0AAV6V3Q6_9ARAC|nr:hypothetical protein JTE90_006073 [Oedothorax gibbosus]
MPRPTPLRPLLTKLLPFCLVVALLLVAFMSFHLVSGTWRRVLESRTTVGTRIRQLNAVADNLSRILMATETESALLNRDVGRFLKIVEKQVGEMKAAKEQQSSSRKQTLPSSRF